MNVDLGFSLIGNNRILIGYYSEFSYEPIPHSCAKITKKSKVSYMYLRNLDTMKSRYLQIYEIKELDGV